MFQVGSLTVEQKVSSCTERVSIETETTERKTGIINLIIAVVVISGFLIGLLLVPLVIFIVLIIMKKAGKGNLATSVGPSATDYQSVSCLIKSSSMTSSRLL